MLRGNDAPYHTVSHPQAGGFRAAFNQKKKEAM